MDTFVNKIDGKILEKHLLSHPFYQAWSRGELAKETLQEYAKDYYQHVRAFPTYLSAVHSRTENEKTRRVLLQNLIEEEAGSPNHPALWRKFAVALGVNEEELNNHSPSLKMKELISTFSTLCSQGSTAGGLATLYAYESQIPDICVSKIKGLRQYYGMQNPSDYAYFTIHIEADREHAADERALLQEYVTAKNAEGVFTAIDKALSALWDFLSTFNVCCTA